MTEVGANRAKRLSDYAKRLSANMTQSEMILWVVLRRGQLGVEFRRQEPILYWIADFWCPLHRLAVELDGRYHASHEQRRKDKRRDVAMARRGIKVLRIPSSLVFTNLNRAIDLIRKDLCSTSEADSRNDLASARKFVLDTLTGASRINVPLLASEAASALLLAQSHGYGHEEIQFAAGRIKRIGIAFVQSAGVLRRAMTNA